MLKRPPQHRVDAPIVFVHPVDPAWDRERVAAEQAEMRTAGEDPKNHPYARYHGGWTRYDLDAPATVLGRVTTAREYLDEAQQPTMWYLRRLSGAQWNEIHPLWQKATRASEPATSAFLRACMIGIVKVENGPSLDMPGGRLSAEDFEQLHRLGHAQDPPIELPMDLGEAVYQASMPLTESEGKR